MKKMSGHIETTSSNAAAMREALDRIFRRFSVDGLGRHWIRLNEWDWQSIKSSLSTTARNCDVFNDAKSARQAWLDDGDNWDDFGNPEQELHEWLYAPSRIKNEKR